VNSQKNLLQINTVANYGSTGRIAEDIGSLAISNGWRSYIAYGRYGRSSESDLLHIGTVPDFYSHVIKTRFFDKHGMASKKATEKFICLLNEIKPDLVHLHNLHGYYINIEVLFNYLSKADIPVVWTMHDCWPITGHCVHFDFVKCDKWKKECGKCVQKKRYPASYFLDRSSENFRLKKQLFNSLENLTIVTVSSWLAEILRQSYLADIPLVTINNGIDTSVFQPVENITIKKKYNLAGKFVILGVASKWDHRKGFDDFIELSKLLDDCYAVIMIGLDKKQIKNLPGNILGLGNTENISELVDFYNVADVFVNTSVEETFGLTSIEAMACGTPSIVYNTTACPEVISEDSGFVVGKKNLYEIINAIETIKEKGKSNYTEACIKRVRKLYNKTERYSDYLKLYNSLLS